MNKNSVLGRLCGISEKIQTGRLHRQEYVAALKQEVANLRRGFVTENSAIRAVWFGPTPAEKAATLAKKTAAERAAVRAKKAAEVAEAERIKKIAEMAAVKAKQIAEAARVKKLATEAAREKQAAEKTKKAMDAIE